MLIGVIVAAADNMQRVVGFASDKFGEVSVVHSVRWGRRYLLAGESVLGAQFLDRAKRDVSAFAGFALMQAAFYVHINSIEPDAFGEPRRALCVGLGAGTVPTFGRNLGWVVDALEIRPAVVDMAATYFGYEVCTANTTVCMGRTIQADANIWLYGEDKHSEENRYSTIFLDVFDGTNSGSLQLLTHDRCVRMI